MLNINRLIPCFPKATEAMCQQWSCYLALLQKWNQVYNLTAITDPEQQFLLHLVDSLSIANFLEGSRILDVGTGAGLPGIPLSIAFPEKRFTLLDSNGKKIRFLEQVRIELSLKNICVQQSRIETFQDPDGFDTILSRAFSELSVFLNTTQSLGHAGSLWLAMKGDISKEELAKVHDPFMIDRVIPLSIPGLEATRQLIMVRKTK